MSDPKKPDGVDSGDLDRGDNLGSAKENPNPTQAPEKGDDEAAAEGMPENPSEGDGAQNG
jgi:hypothetical protein